MKTLQHISKRMAGSITTLLLSAAYLLGIGIVALFVKTNGRGMLGQLNKKTTWQKPSGSGRMERMF